MKQLVHGLKLLALHFLSSFLAKELKDARERWGRGLKSDQLWLMIIIAALSMYGLWYWAFGQGFMFGVSFVTAAILAVVRGHIFAHPFQLFLLAIAVVIGKLVIPDLLEDAWEALLQGEVLVAAAIAFVGILFWRLKKQYESGQVMSDETKSPTRRRKSRQR